MALVLVLFEIRHRFHSWVEVVLNGYFWPVVLHSLPSVPTFNMPEARDGSRIHHPREATAQVRGLEITQGATANLKWGRFSTMDSSASTDPVSWYTFRTMDNNHMAKVGYTLSQH